ncbi:hypothetical protein F4604DRAFT_1959800, partial [Suillus subluteus]
MPHDLTASFHKMQNVLKANPQDSRTQKDNIMERYNIAAALHGRRSRRGRHSGQDLGPPDPHQASAGHIRRGSRVSDTSPPCSPQHLLGRLHWPAPWIKHPGPRQLNTLAVRKLGHEMRGASVVAAI